VFSKIAELTLKYFKLGVNSVSCSICFVQNNWSLYALVNFGCNWATYFKKNKSRISSHRGIHLCHTSLVSWEMEL